MVGPDDECVDSDPLHLKREVMILIQVAAHVQPIRQDHRGEWVLCARLLSRDGCLFIPGCCRLGGRERRGRICLS